MIQDILGGGMSVITKVAGNPILDRWGLRAPFERALRRSAEVSIGGINSAIQWSARRNGAPKAAPTRMDAPRKPPRLFDLTLTEEQEMVRDSVRRLARDVLRGAAEAADEAMVPPQEVLDATVELGLNMLAVPEELEGVGMERSPTGGVLILEDLAHGDMALALAVASPLSVINLLVDFGSAAQQARYLPTFAGETFVHAAFAMLEPQPLFDPFALKTRAIKTDGRYVLYGEKSMVPLGATSSLFIVAADLMGAGPRLFIVEPDAEHLTITPEPTMGLRGAGLVRLGLDGVTLAPDAILGGDDGAGALDYQRVVDRGRMGWSAMSLGCGQAILDYVKVYCNERFAFGEPITNRQSVAFMIADINIELEGMRLMVYRAASRAEHDLSASREAYLAHIQCAKKAMDFGTNGVQLLGGAGFIKDHPVERWYRHVRALGFVEGGVYV